MTGLLARKDNTYHGERIGVGDGQRVPLHHNLTGRAGIGAVVAGLTGLVRAHGPSSVRSIRGHRDEANIGRELALSTLFLESRILLRASFMACMVVAVAVAVASGINARNEGDERSRAGRGDLELHFGGLVKSDWIKRMEASNE